jgi:predicted metal-dependent hydrolase
VTFRRKRARLTIEQMTMTDPTTQANASSEKRTPITVRRREPDFSRVPRHWLGGRKSVTTFFDNLSTFFPAGERFFIAAVRAHDAHVTSDALRADVRAFAGQEGFHSKAHEGYNALLERQGYPAKQLEREIAELLVWVTKRTNRRQRLGATCALEHLTSLLAKMLMDSDHALDGADETMASLWTWHAVEENEHKAVAFDVYRATNAPYWERALAMVLANVIFWPKLIEHQARMMAVDGTSTSAREWLALLHYTFIEPGVVRRILPEYVSYFRPGFHPNDIDSSALIAKWVSEDATT